MICCIFVGRRNCKNWPSYFWSIPSGWKWYVHFLPLSFDQFMTPSLRLVKCGQTLGHTRSTLPKCIVQLDCIKFIEDFLEYVSLIFQPKTHQTWVGFRCTFSQDIHIVVSSSKNGQPHKHDF